MKTVLVVDDDQPVRLLLAKMIKKAGANPICVPNGKEAEKLLSGKCHFDLIFLDLIMPDKSGWDVLDLIRNTAELRKTPVILCTGTAVSEAERNRLLQKADDIVNKKQFTIASFENTLEKWLQKS